LIVDVQRDADVAEVDEYVRERIQRAEQWWINGAIRLLP